MLTALKKNKKNLPNARSLLLLAGFLPLVACSSWNPFGSKENEEFQDRRIPVENSSYIATPRMQQLASPAAKNAKAATPQTMPLPPSFEEGNIPADGYNAGMPPPMPPVPAVPGYPMTPPAVPAPVTLSMPNENGISPDSYTPVNGTAIAPVEEKPSFFKRLFGSSSTDKNAATAPSTDNNTVPPMSSWKETNLPQTLPAPVVTSAAVAPVPVPAPVKITAPTALAAPVKVTAAKEPAPAKTTTPVVLVAPVKVASAKEPVTENKVTASDSSWKNPDLLQDVTSTKTKPVTAPVKIAAPTPAPVKTPAPVVVAAPAKAPVVAAPVKVVTPTPAPVKTPAPVVVAAPVKAPVVAAPVKVAAPTPAPVKTPAPVVVAAPVKAPVVAAPVKVATPTPAPVKTPAPVVVAAPAKAPVVVAPVKVASPTPVAVKQVATLTATPVSREAFPSLSTVPEKPARLQDRDELQKEQDELIEQQKKMEQERKQPPASDSSTAPPPPAKKQAVAPAIAELPPVVAPKPAVIVAQKPTTPLIVEEDIPLSQDTADEDSSLTFANRYQNRNTVASTSTSVRIYRKTDDGF